MDERGGEEPAILIHRDGDTERLQTDRRDAYQLQLEDFAAAINGERAPLLGRDDATAQAAVIGGCTRPPIAAGRCN